MFSGGGSSKLKTELGGQRLQTIQHLGDVAEATIDDLHG